MFDKLVDVLMACAEHLRIYTIVYAWERGVHTRCGIFYRVVDPGMRWQLPFIDSIMTETVVPNTSQLRDQSLITEDGKDITLSAVITYRIDDVRAFLMDVEGRADAVADIAFGAIAEYAAANTLDHLRDPKNWRKIATEIRGAGKEYGINVLRVKLCDISRSRSLRLLGDR